VSFISSSCPLSRLRGALQAPQSRAPKSLDESDEFIESFRSHHIEALRSHTPLVEKASLTQHTDVLRNRRPRQLEPSGDGSSRHFARTNQLYDLEPGLVAQGLNLDQHGQLSISFR
jgi:hypothetical protein